MFGFFKARKQPCKKLLVLGTEFGSYQFNQLVEMSSEYEILGFISDDPWQKKSGFGKVGVYASSELASLCENEEVVAVILPSDQKEVWLKDKETDSSQGSEGSTETDSVESPIAGLEGRLKTCDVLSIPSELNRTQANQFLDTLISD